MFEEVPARMRLEAGLTGSATVNAIASVAVSSSTDWLARAVMVGKTIGPRATMRKPVVALPLAGFPLPRKSERMSASSAPPLIAQAPPRTPRVAPAVTTASFHSATLPL